MLLINSKPVQLKAAKINECLQNLGCMIKQDKQGSVHSMVLTDGLVFTQNWVLTTDIDLSISSLIIVQEMAYQLIISLFTFTLLFTLITILKCCLKEESLFVQGCSEMPLHNLCVCLMWIVSSQF